MNNRWDSGQLQASLFVYHAEIYNPIRETRLSQSSSPLSSQSSILDSLMFWTIPHAGCEIPMQQLYSLDLLLRTSQSIDPSLVSYVNHILLEADRLSSSSHLSFIKTNFSNQQNK
jgi:hypothetical protein